MRKVLFLATMVLAIVGFSVNASAQNAADSTTVTSTAQSGGTKKAPKPVSPSWEGTFTGSAPGARATGPAEHNWKWTGIFEYGQYFPTCTADEIDGAQSDSGCDPKSLVATGSIVAKLGPVGNLTENINCNKSLSYYNGGAGKMSLYAYGPAEQCAGVGYLPPIPITWVKDGDADEQRFTFPDNIREPLPGIEGGFESTKVEFKNLTTKIKKKVKVPGKKKKVTKKVKVGYLMSTGCKGDRKFTFTGVPKDNSGDAVAEVTAGKC